MLDDRPGAMQIERRDVEARWTLAISKQTSFAWAGGWLDGARHRLAAALESSDLRRSGPDSSLYYEEPFTEGGCPACCRPAIWLC